jgi:S-adenosylmethionine hydrolase
MNPSIKRPVVALLTDFGSGDGDVGVMKGVIAGITPDVHIIDITHDVAPQNVASAAWILTSAYRYFPATTVFVCVVDPGVGSSRGAIALHAGDWFFVGPDNGLFSSIIQEQTVHGAVELANPAYRLPQVSSTFHGRDIFAPAGAHLAGSGTDVFAKLGPALDPAALITLPTTTARRQGNTVEASILHVDNFGNLITSIPLALVPELFSAEQARIVFPEYGVSVSERRRFFADGPENGQPFLYGDSSGYVGIAVRNGNAARTLGVGYGAAITFDISAG